MVKRCCIVVKTLEGLRSVVKQLDQPRIKDIRIGRVRITPDEILAHPNGTTLRQQDDGCWRVVKSNDKEFLVQQEPSEDEAQSQEEDGNDDDDSMPDAQRLSAQDIETLRDSGVKGSALLSKVVAGSRTFKSKTLLAQEKYVRRKAKKHVLQLTLLKPTVREVAETYEVRDFAKIGRLRFDALSRMLMLSGLCTGSEVMLYDLSMGLLTAGVVERLGGQGIVYVVEAKGVSDKIVGEVELSEECPKVIRKIPSELAFGSTPDPLQTTWLKEIPDAPEGATEAHLATIPRNRLRREKRMQEWVYLTENGVDCVVAALSATRLGTGDARNSQVHNITRGLRETVAMAEKFVKPGGRLVVHASLLEPLAELQARLQLHQEWLQVEMDESFLRKHQVLPQRTHPDMRASVNLLSGFILSAIRISPMSRND